jgi:dTDP-4-amino-4,6-dideoxygalactose transaminase
MMTPYASPNLRLRDLAAALMMLEKDAEEQITHFFSSLTGKPYVLITNSCRSALFLAYTAAGIRGEVVTSPLTCKVAIDPIVESGNTPVFADISMGDLNIRADDIAHRITEKTIAIQAIHLGGVVCDMAPILAVAKKRDLLVVEDCAQSLGATHKGKPAGSFGDVACFSLIKNGYGIGGGILATHDKALYQKAKYINAYQSPASPVLAVFRILRNLLDTQRSREPAFLLYRLLMRLKRDRQSYSSVTAQLHPASAVEKKISARQIARWETLHARRRKIGRRYYDRLVSQGLMQNHGFDPEQSSFTKFFVYHPGIRSKKHLKILEKMGIEAMHLEQKHGSPFQERLVPAPRKDAGNLKNYDKVHDCLVSLPVLEDMGEEWILFVIKTLKNIQNEHK